MLRLENTFHHTAVLWILGLARVPSTGAFKRNFPPSGDSLLANMVQVGDVEVIDDLVYITRRTAEVYLIGEALEQNKHLISPTKT